MQMNWNVLSADESVVKSLAKELNVSTIVARLLVLRGITCFEDARLFFRPELDHLHDPFLMKDMLSAVNRIEKAIRENEKILVYGDYDVDGTTSVAMMYLFLSKESENIEYYIPCRYNEGYGISLKGINYAKSHKFSLIIALDCGIRAIDQVNYANANNIDIIICDHHTPSNKIPKATAVLNPKQNKCTYPYKELSGCGVGFKLIHAYCIKNDIAFSEIAEYLDLLTISIGADIVPMTGENRIFSFYGLKQINSRPRNGIKALMEIANKTSNLSVSDVVFGIAPRINAAGRIEHAKKAVEILIEQNFKKARILALSIEKDNLTRKELDQNITEEALGMIDESKKSTVVFSEKWHKGVLGIVASRLIEKHYKPTIVLAENNGVFTGSARSVHDFDLYQAISKCAHLCEKFGGHKYAAGLSIKKDNLDEFIIQFEKAVTETINQDHLSPKIKVDMIIDIEEVNDKLFRILRQFAPFGPKNNSPIFVSENVVDNGYGRKVGEDQSHLSINIKRIKNPITAIGFRMGNYFDYISNSKKFNICYSIQENIWKGRRKLQITLKDLKANAKA